jgi:hypothetical protein
MQGKKKLLQTLGVIFFSVGVLVGIALFVFMNWAYMEAYFFFGYIAPADQPLTTLRCPVLMTSGETGAVTASLTNDTSRDISPAVQIELSYYGAATLSKTNYPIGAGETRTIRWPVTKEDVVFGDLIMARVYVYSTYTLPSRSNTCGTVVVDLPGVSGTDLFAILLAASLGCLAAGWGLWFAGSRPLQENGLIAFRALVFFTSVVILGILAGCFGWWLLGLICAVACVLLIITVVGYYIQKA